MLAFAALNYQITKLPNYQLDLHDSNFSSDPLGHESFNDIALLYIIEVADGDAALHTVGALAGVALEALERADLALVDLDPVAHQPHFGIALDVPVEHVAAGDRSHLGHPEGLAHFGAPLVVFLDDGLEQSGH